MGIVICDECRRWNLLRGKCELGLATACKMEVDDIRNANARCGFFRPTRAEWKKVER